MDSFYTVQIILHKKKSMRYNTLFMHILYINNNDNNNNNKDFYSEHPPHKVGAQGTLQQY